MCFDHVTKKIILNRHAIFDKNSFIVQNWSPSQPRPFVITSSPRTTNPSLMVLNSHLSQVVLNLPTLKNARDALGVANRTHDNLSLMHPFVHLNLLHQHQNLVLNNLTPLDSLIKLVDIAQAPTTTLSCQPPYLSIHPIITHSQQGSRKNKQLLDYYMFYSTKHSLQAYHSTISHPTQGNFAQASKVSLESSNGRRVSSIIVQCKRSFFYPWPLHKNVIPNKWVYKVKHELMV